MLDAGSVVRMAREGQQEGVAEDWMAVHEGMAEGWPWGRSALGIGRMLRSEFVPPWFEGEE